MRVSARSRLIAAALAGMAVWAAPVPAHAVAVDNFDETGGQPFMEIYVQQSADVGALTTQTGEYLSDIGPGFCKESDSIAPYVIRTAWWKVRGNGRALTAHALGDGWATTVGVYGSREAVFPGGDPPPTYLDCGYTEGHNESAATWNSEAGRTYWIQAGQCVKATTDVPDPPCHQATGATNRFIAWVSSAPPGNDARSAPTPLGASATADNNGATLATGETSNCAGVIYDKTVWFRHVTPEQGLLSVSVSGLSGVVSLLRASDGAVVGCGSGAASARVGKGQEYLVQVGGTGFGTGASESAFTIGTSLVPDADHDNSLAGADCDDNDPTRKARADGGVEKRGNAVDEDCDLIALPFRSLPKRTDVKLSYGSGGPKLKILWPPARSKLKIRCTRCSKPSIKRSFRRGRKRLTFSARALGSWRRGAVVKVDITKRFRIGTRWKWRMKQVPKFAGECKLVPGVKPRC